MFQVGDYITIKRGSPYTYSRYKSTGTILEVYPSGYLQIKFDHLTGDYHKNFEPIWNINPAHCKLTKRLPQQEKVCAKISSIYARQYRKTGYAFFL